MRDPLLDQNNAYFVACRRACDATREEAKDFADAETIVSGLSGWCRDIAILNDLRVFLFFSILCFTFV